MENILVAERDYRTGGRCKYKRKYIRVLCNKGVFLYFDCDDFTKLHVIK